MRPVRVSKLLHIAFVLLISSVQSGMIQGQQGIVASGAAEKVILDTDIGDDIDDVFALGIALTSPEFHLIGITSAWGDTALRSRMIDRILCETGRDDIPVFKGLATHRQDAAAFSQAPWSRAGVEHKHGDAVAFLLDQAKKYPGEVTLIAIAPLTNIGAAIDRDPAAFKKYKRVVLMGGSIDRGYGPPGTKPMAEYNIKMDPAAAKKLFGSGVPIYMMPLDSTQIYFDKERRSQLASISTPLTDSIEVLTAEWSSVTNQSTPTLFDPVAVAYAIDPKTCPVTPEHIDVDDDGNTRVTPGAPNAWACLEEKPGEFFSLVMPRLMEQRLSGSKVCVDRR